MATLIRRRLALASGCATLALPLVAAKAQETRLPLVETAGLNPLNVDVGTHVFQGRQCVRLRLSEGRQRVVMQQAVGNGATMALLPGEYGNATIRVDIAAEVNGRGAPDSRGFVGIAFRSAANGDRFEAIYLRMTNGTLADPPPGPPRNVRAIQYISHPDFHFHVSRQASPDTYEKAAPVAIGRWFAFRIEVAGTTARAFIGDQKVLDVPDLRLGAAARGRIGLWVDDGTDGYFSNLSITPT